MNLCSSDKYYIMEPQLFFPNIMNDYEQSSPFDACNCMDTCQHTRL